METIFRRILTLVGAMLALTTVFAQEVDEATAQQRALNFLQKSSSKSKSKDGKTPAMNVTLAHTSKGDMGNNYYAYNIGKNEGFIVVSADEKAEEVLCYADEGKFDVDNMAPAMKWWMGEYEKQIQAAKSAKIHNASTLLTSNEDQRSEISPMLQTNWGQKSPFNKLTPIVSLGVQAPTGCVATAMAQILNFHKYPSLGQGYHSYVWTNEVTGIQESLSTDFSQSIYDWDAMPQNINGTTGLNAEAALSRLMYDCGVSIDMDYGFMESGASVSSVPGALIKYFSYDNHTVAIDRTYFENDNWEDVIYNELRNHRPVLYSGMSSSLSEYEQNVKSDDSHAFVCDGYKSGGYYHFNFGWNGNGNGFFKLNAILNAVQDYNYNSGQCAILVYPSSLSNEDYPYAFDIKGIVFDKQNYGKSDNMILSIGGYNYYSEKHDVQLGIKLINKENNEVSVIQSPSKYTIQGMDYKQINDFNVSCSTFANGSYEVSVVYYDRNGNLINSIYGESIGYRYNMDVDSEKIVISPIEQKKDYKLQASFSDGPSSYYKGHGLKVCADISNVGDRDYFGTVGLYVVNDNNSLSLYDITNVHIESNSSKKVELGTNDTNIEWLETLVGGNIKFVLSTSNFGNDAICEPFSINVLDCSSYPIEYNGCYYRLINDNEACVTYSDATMYTADIVIPSTICYNGHDFSVTAIGDHLLTDMSEDENDHVSAYAVKSIDIPSSVKFIGTQRIHYDIEVKVHWDDPSLVKSNIIFQNWTAIGTLSVPVGKITSYINSDNWNIFKVFNDGVTNIKNNRFDIIVKGGGIIEKYVNENKTEMPNANYVDGNFKENYVASNTDTKIKLVPLFGNNVIGVSYDYTDITNRVESNMLSLNDEIFGRELNNPYVTNACKIIYVYYGFDQNGVNYSAISDKEIIVMPSFTDGDGHNYEGIIDIPSTITKNGKEYIVGNLSQDVIGNSTSKVIVHWADPIDVNELGINEQAFDNTVLDVPMGTFEKYAAHKTWGKFSKISEGGVLRKNDINITLISNNYPSEGTTSVNGKNLPAHWPTCTIGKDEDIIFEFHPNEAFELSWFEWCNCNLYPEVIDNKYVFSNARIKEFIEDQQAVGVTNPAIQFFIDYSIHRNGVWYTPNSYTVGSHYWPLEDTDMHEEIDTIYCINGVNVTKGIYTGDVKIPEKIWIDGIRDFSDVAPNDGKTIYNVSTEVPVERIEQMLRFGSCENLHSIDIPASIHFIGDYTLYDSHYKYLIVHWDTPLNIDYHSFCDLKNEDINVFDNVTLMVPVGTLEKYKNHATWGLFKSIVEGDDWRAYEGEYIVGDANNSGDVNVADITAVVSHIYGQTPANFNAAAADVNHNGEINVADITGIVSIIYGGSASGAKGASKAKVDEVAMSMPTVTVNAGAEVCVPICIDNADAISAYQFDLALPEDVQVKDVRSISDAHQCVGAYMEDGKYRVMSYSMTNERFVNATAPVGYITLVVDGDAQEGTYNVNLSSATTAANDKDYKTHVGSGKLIIGGTTGINYVDNNAVDTREIATLGGVKVASNTKLPKGVYIVTGKKQVVR